MNKKYTKDMLTQAVNTCYSVRQLLIYFNLKETGGNYTNMAARLKEFEIDTTHFHGMLWSKGKEIVTDINHMLVEDSTYSSGRPRSSSKLRKRLVVNGLKEDKCEICGISDWFGNKLSLHLHHKNGVHIDNRIENIQILCPNCHSLASTYRVKNRSAQKEIFDVETVKFGEVLTDNPEPSLSNKEGVET